MRLLVIEDDDRVAPAVRAVLLQHGFDVDLARNAAQALALLADPPDVILLDLGLPDRDGFSLCSEMRRLCSTPIIVVTARGDPRSRVHGLNIGADDYLVKPYDVAELIARIHAIWRRVHPAEATATGPADLTALGSISIDADGRKVTVNGEPVALTRKEYDLLLMLARQPGVVFRREQLLSAIWGTTWRGANRTLEVHIASVRHKLGRPAAIETVRGVGYRFLADSEGPAASPTESPTEGRPASPTESPTEG
jgi:DNA-binding response OmpR family regulator